MKYGTAGLCLNSVYFTALFNPNCCPFPCFQYAFYGRKVTSSVSIPGPEEGVCLGWRKSRLEEVATDTVRFGDYTRYLLGSGTTSSKLDQTSFFKFLREREDGAVLALLHDRKVSPVLQTLTQSTN